MSSDSFSASPWTPVSKDAQVSPSSGPHYGMHTIIPRDPLTAGITDIVAIHGLNGHYEKTWTEELSGYSWLRDVFSSGSRLEFASRVMSFSYNAKVQHSKSTADIFDFATQLLESLLVERKTEVEKSRPIIFVCHSLGGIVFKQAFNKAKGESRYSDLVRNFIGVLFFGTPHKGAAIASAARMLGKVLKATSLGTGTNTQLLKSLEIHSVELEQISDTFLQLAERLRIVTFYELDKMDYVGSVVVSKESAVMRMKNETAVPLNGNHRTICRFPSRSDKSLGIVLGHLAAINQRATGSGSQTDQELLLRDLATSNPDLHKSRNPRAVPGTCGWLLKHNTYLEWLHKRDPALLWLSADYGCGKSVLASFLIDHLRSQAAFGDMNICYFFFKADNDEQRDAVHGLQAILRQLLQVQQQLLKVAANEFDRKKIGSVDALWQMLMSMVENKLARKTVCVIDGLDECEPDSRKVLARLLSNLFARSREPASESGEAQVRIKFIILSRPENSLKIAFDRTQSPTSRASMIRLRGEDEIDNISHDIGLVIDAEISDIVDRGLPEELLKEVRQELVARADRTFLWVTLILQLMQDKVEAGASRRELREILKSRNIDAIYSEMLSTRPDAPKARKLLSLVLAASRPLSVEELGIALAIKPEVETFSPRKGPKRPGKYCMDDVEDDLVYPLENHIKALCGHFIRVIRNKVYLVHETAREFLLESPDSDRGEQVEETWFELDDDEETLSPDNHSIATDLVSVAPYAEVAGTISSSWQNSFILRQCHAIMLEVCVTFLYCIGKASSSQPAGGPSRRTAPFLDYAAVEWHSHFRNIRDDMTSQGIAYYQNLCHPRFPGFEAWVSAFEHHEAQSLQFTAGTTTGRLRQKGMSDDEVQDYFVVLLGIEAEEETHNAGGWRKYRLDEAEKLRNEMRHMSSNPTAVMNGYFPVTADENGYVSLNTAALQGETSSTASPWENPWKD